MNEHIERPSTPRERRHTPAKAWARAIETTRALTAGPHRCLADVIDARAAETPEAPALLSDRECFDYAALAARIREWSCWAQANGLARGDRVGLMMSARPDYVAIWLALSRLGIVVALLNTRLTGRALAHCVDVADPRHLIVEPRFSEVITSASSFMSSPHAVTLHDLEATTRDCALVSDRTSDSAEPSRTDCALLIYTSGTTGLPKAARISHARILDWSGWFAGLLDIGPQDRTYDCLPLDHSVGGIVGVGAALSAGASVAIAEHFSARAFWSDVRRWDCTLVQYIGELCRFLLSAEPHPEETRHRVRAFCGNGLRGDVWEPFASRFAIPRILEFYAATEGNVTLYNVEGKVGALGRIPPFLAQRFRTALVRFDVASERPVRDADGRCIACETDEVGEAIGRIDPARNHDGDGFEGYTDADATERKVLRDVFEPGDAWYRTGDLMRRDAQGFYWFVDRIGDTFRWKGENVATAQVADVIRSFPGVGDATVYGVAVPHTDGRAGMATITATGTIDLDALWRHVEDALPTFARPVFLRIGATIETTATFKHVKRDLVARGFAPPTDEGEAVWFADRRAKRYVPLDAATHEAIMAGRIVF